MSIGEIAMLMRLSSWTLRQDPYTAVLSYIARFSKLPFCFVIRHPHLHLSRDLELGEKHIRRLYKIIDILFVFDKWMAGRKISETFPEPFKDGIDQTVGGFMEWLEFIVSHWGFEDNDGWDEMHNPTHYDFLHDEEVVITRMFNEVQWLTMEPDPEPLFFYGAIVHHTQTEERCVVRETGRCVHGNICLVEIEDPKILGNYTLKYVEEEFLAVRL